MHHFSSVLNSQTSWSHLLLCYILCGPLLRWCVLQTTLIYLIFFQLHKSFLVKRRNPLLDYTVLNAHSALAQLLTHLGTCNNGVVTITWAHVACFISNFSLETKTFFSKHLLWKYLLKQNCSYLINFLLPSLRHKKK